MTTEVESGTTVADLKRSILERVSKIGERQIDPDNLVLSTSRFGDTTA